MEGIYTFKELVIFISSLKDDANWKQYTPGIVGSLALDSLKDDTKWKPYTQTITVSSMKLENKI